MDWIYENSVNETCIPCTKPVVNFNKFKIPLKGLRILKAMKKVEEYKKKDKRMSVIFYYFHILSSYLTYVGVRIFEVFILYIERDSNDIVYIGY